MEWISDKRDLPIWAYDAPNIIRNIKWLSFWGGKTARMYGISKVSIVDVRSEKEFAEGHIPFAINIPSEIFREYSERPDKLIEVLNTTGFDPLDEAVIVSGKGLSEESALAFITLQKLGQKNVSILIGNKEQWTQGGFTLIKDTENTQLRKTGNDSKNNSKPNTLNIQEGVIEKELTDMPENFPRVFITSGEKMQLNVADKKNIHLPYTKLLNEDGNPKPANEIWNIISKAGVPRYVELVCISEEPGEAAINYFLLKLMGYPDVKVWLNTF